MVSFTISMNFMIKFSCMPWGIEIFNGYKLMLSLRGQWESIYGNWMLGNKTNVNWALTSAERLPLEQMSELPIHYLVFRI